MLVLWHINILEWSKLHDQVVNFDSTWILFWIINWEFFFGGGVQPPQPPSGTTSLSTAG